jgi:hypothetical protein
MNRRGGCLSGLLQIFLLGWLFDWLQNTFGWGRNKSCAGCGCGFILFLIFAYLILATLTGWRIFSF